MAPPASTARNAQLRPMRAFVVAALGVARHRGLALLGVSGIVWGSFSAVTLVLLPRVVDLPALLDLGGDLAEGARASVAGRQVTGEMWSAVQVAGDGEWLRHGWWGLAASGSLWLLGYLACVAAATTGCVTVAWAWLERGDRLGVGAALGRGVRRGPQTAVALGAWMAAIWAVVLVLLVAPTVWLTARQLWWGLAVALPLGAAACGATFLWMASRWALAAQAASLSTSGWRALGSASRVAEGSRGRVVGRWLLTGGSIALVVGVIGAVLLVLAGHLPDHVLVVSGIVAARVALSASQAAFSAAATTSVYLDLDGDTAGASPG